MTKTFGEVLLAKNIIFCLEIQRSRLQKILKTVNTGSANTELEAEMTLHAIGMFLKGNISSLKHYYDSIKANDWTLKFERGKMQYVQNDINSFLL